MISREDLYRLVWTEPMTKIAERSEVSGSYLARMCTLLDVPRPERGYWAKLAVGKAPPQPSLPPPGPTTLLHWSRESERVALPRRRPTAPPRPRAPVKVRIAQDRVHGVIHGAAAHFRNSRPVKGGGYLKPFKKLLVDVTASPACLDRALDLANELFNALDSVGHRVLLAATHMKLSGIRVDEREMAAKPRDAWQYDGLWSPYQPTVVFVGDVAIGLQVVEMSENVDVRYVDGKFVRASSTIAERGHSKRQKISLSS